MLGELSPRQFVDVYLRLIAYIISVRQLQKFDVSEFQEKKMKAIMAYKSQFYNPKSKEPNTPISSKSFIDSIKQRDQNFGRISGVDAAEGFTLERPPVIKDIKGII